MRSRPLALLLVALCCQGCTLFVSVPPLEPLPEDHVLLTQLQYVPQSEDWDCGPACLATMMRHCGLDLSLSDLKGELKRTDDGGVIPLELICAARRRGLQVRSYSGDVNDLRRNLLEGRPLVLMLHPLPGIVRMVTTRRGHYVVAVGYDDREREAYVHTGEAAFEPISYRRLQLEWSRTGFLTLRIER